ncbi:hypothetical protein LC612_39100 [Nostoc sp. CHAB 5834]|nr:hypothetical protein [Nostoc sp. CHAB 5834]
MASQRAARGLSPWKGNLEFMSLLAPLVTRFESGDTSLKPEELLAGFHAAAKEVRAKIRQANDKFESMEDEDLHWFVQTVEDWTVEYLQGSPDIIGEFNDALDRLYDWCDANRWWIAP